MGKRPKYKQGMFKPRFPKKYKGNPNNIVFRSGLELKYFNFLDTRKNVLKWNSEEFYIPYTGVDGRRHKYYVDVWIRVKNKKGEIREYIVEIKPSSETKPPAKPKRITKSYKYKIATWMKNKLKWEAAEKFAEKNNQTFLIATERNIK